MIRINEKYYVDCDSYQFIVGEIYRVKDKESKNFGKEQFKATSFHGNAEHVVNKLLDLGLKNYIDTSDFGAVLAYMQNVKSSVKNIIDLKTKNK